MDFSTIFVVSAPINPEITHSNINEPGFIDFINTSEVSFSKKSPVRIFTNF